MKKIVAPLFTLVLAVSAFGQTFPPMTQLPTGVVQLDPSPSSTSFTFVVAGDNRPAHDGDPLTKPLLDIVSQLAANPPDFVVWNGDSVYGKQDVGITEQYAQFLGAFKPLTVPVFNAPGNHEMVVQTMIACGTKADPYNGELPDFSGSMMADYETAMGPLYGMFRYGNAAFLIINTDDVLDVTLTNACGYNGYVGKTQLAALQATLDQLAADATVTHVFCFMHRPVKDKGGSQIGAPKGDTSDYGTQVEAFRHLLDKGKYPKMTFVFASHDHLLYVSPTPANPNGPFTGTAPNKGKPVFIVTGGAGAPLSGCKNGKDKPGAYFHYTTVTVSGAGVTVNVVPLYGTTPCGSGT
jgi:Predicted phosphohydrolases